MATKPRSVVAWPSHDDWSIRATGDTAKYGAVDIRFDVGCNHHVLCYLAMLDFIATVAAIIPVPAGEEDSARCIRGPQTDRPTLPKSLAHRIVKVAGQYRSAEGG